MNERFTRVGVVLTGLLAVGAWTASSAQAALVAEYNFNGNANDSVGGFHGTIVGGAAFVASPVGGQAIDLSGSGQYVTTAATASALGIGGNNPKTITAWVRTEAFTNAGVWQIGNYASNQEFGLRTTTTTNGWLAQFYGPADFGFSAPGSLNTWTHFALVHDGVEGRAYVNGILAARLASTLNTVDTRPLTIGLWHPSWPALNGQMDRVRVYDEALTAQQIAAQFRGDGGLLVDFEGTGGQLPADWYVSGGMNGTRLRSTYGTPDGAWALVPHDNDANDPPGTLRNVYNGGGDNNTSMAWGPIFQVKDPTAAVSFKIVGGNYNINDSANVDPNGQRNGPTGVALWDLAANDYVREPNGDVRFVTHTNSSSFAQRSISLAGLEGKWVSLVLLDRRVGGWAWNGIDSITAPPGSVTVLDSQMHHKVYLEYGFDEPGDFMGWTGDLGSFQVGNTPGGLATRHINLKGTFTIGEGFLSSTTATIWDGATGTLRSPEFTVQGDIIEFYVAGGNQDNLSFELWVDMDGAGTFTLQRTSRHQADVTEFDYDFWRIADLRGRQAYFRLVDANPGGWGHIHVDAIRMVGFAVPEPSTLVLSALGAAGLAALALRRRSGLDALRAR